jgi:hypothetical protein
MWGVSRAPVIDRATWRAWDEGYKVVNCQFAQAIVQRIRVDPWPMFILLQDYHLYLVARYVHDQIRRVPFCPLSELTLRPAGLSISLLRDFLDAVWDFLRGHMVCFNYRGP